MSILGIFDENRAVRALERIADALEYFALADARSGNRMFMPKHAQQWAGEDQSDLLSTTKQAVQEAREEAHQVFLEGGYEALTESEEEWTTLKPSSTNLPA